MASVSSLELLYKDVSYMHDGQVNVIDIVSAKNLVSMPDTGGAPIDLFVGASRDINIAALRDVNVALGSTSTLTVADAASNDSLVVVTDATKTTVHGGEKILNLGTSNDKVWLVDRMAVSSSNFFQVLTTEEQGGFMIKDPLFVAGFQNISESLSVGCNVMANSNMFAQNYNLFRHRGVVDKTLVGYAFTINENDQLELIKFSNFSNDMEGQTQVAKKVAVFGYNTLGSNDTSDANYLEFSGLGINFVNGDKDTTTVSMDNFLPNDSVTTSKIVAGAITADKLDPSISIVTTGSLTIQNMVMSMEGNSLAIGSATSSNDTVRIGSSGIQLGAGTQPAVNLSVLQDMFKPTTSNLVRSLSQSVSVSSGSVYYLSAYSTALGKYIALGNSIHTYKTSTVATSTDGFSWTEYYVQEMADNGATINTLCWSEEKGVFVAVDNDPTTVYTSANGLDWTVIPITAVGAEELDIQKILWCPEISKFIGCSRTLGADSDFLTSSDGVTWALGAAPFDGQFADICYSPALQTVLCVASNSSEVLVSTDGVTWTTRDTLNDATWSSCLWVDDWSSFVIYGKITETGASKGMKSPDGVTWTAFDTIDLTDEYSWKKPIYMKEISCVFSSKYVEADDPDRAQGYYFLYSADGETWEWAPVGMDTVMNYTWVYTPLDQLIFFMFDSFSNACEIVTINVEGNLTQLSKTSDLIFDNAVTTVKIADSNVTAAKMAANSVLTVHVADSNVTASKIDRSSIGVWEVAATDSNNLFYTAGTLGVGLSNPDTAYRLDIVGDAQITGTFYSDTGVQQQSDARYKTDVVPIFGALEKVKKIGGYTYTFQSDERAQPRRDAGVIAQEVREVLPEVVRESSTGYLSVSYGNMVSLLIEAIKELSDKVDSIKN